MRKIFSVKNLILSIISLCSFSAAAQTEINWMTWKDVETAQKQKPRKVYVDTYTDWCGWCKKMDASTFTHPEVVKYINENFYAVKFDAETKENISFNGKQYKYVPSGGRGYNELAAELLNGQLSYPTSVYLDEKLNVIFPAPGYQDAKMFESVIHYVNSNSYKSTAFDVYQNQFKGNIQ